MPRTQLYFGLAPLLAVLHIATPASATDFCIVQKSADGYVALRATPSASGALLVRAKPGEAVVIQKKENGSPLFQVGSLMSSFPATR